MTADASYVMSAFLKKGNTQWLRFTFNNGANIARGWFDLTNGFVGSATAAGTASSVSVSIESFANGWYRCTLVGKIGSGATTIVFGIYSASADASNTRVNNATYYAWGAQVEDNVAFPSSYIPTNSSTASRNADVLTYVTAGNVSETAGTIYAEGKQIGIQSGTASIVGLDNVNKGFSFKNNLDTKAEMYDGTNNPVSNIGNSALTVVTKNIGAWDASGMAVGRDGTAILTSAYTGSFTLAASLGVGNRGGTGASQSAFATLRNVRIYGVKLSAAQLQAMTTP